MTSTVSPRSVWLFPNSRCLLPSQRPSPPHGARILRRQQQSAKPRGNPARGNPLSSHGLIIRTSRAFGEYFRYLTAAQSRCYLFPIYRMSRELDFEGLRDDEGRLFTPTATPEWERPNRVELRKAVFRFADAESELKGNALKMVTLGPELHIETSRREAFEDVEESRIVRPKPDLLERFIRLAKASDGQIRNFAMRYGGLEIFFGDRAPFSVGSHRILRGLAVLRPCDGGCSENRRKVIRSSACAGRAMENHRPAATGIEGNGRRANTARTTKK